MTIAVQASSPPPSCSGTRIAITAGRRRRQARRPPGDAARLPIEVLVRRAGPGQRRRCPRRRHRPDPASHVADVRVDRDGTDVIDGVRQQDAGSLVGLVDGLVDGRNTLAVSVAGTTASSRRRARLRVTNSPDQRSDRLRCAPAALRVHDGAGHVRRPQTARPAARRQPGGDRDRGRRRGARRQLPAGRAWLPHGGRRHRRMERRLCDADPVRVRLPLDQRRLPLARRPGRPAGRRRHHDDAGRRHGAVRRPSGSVARSTASSTASPCSPRPARRSRRCPDDSAWNDRLVLSFQGGVAIGHHPGHDEHGCHAPRRPARRAGYGVVWSSGTRTSTHYDLQVGGETALDGQGALRRAPTAMPLYTVAVGGSGGAIQQIRATPRTTRI